ncbi:Hypothetical protein, putative [Bodo saltans]|uniref:Uncharacterized protein n=1 Tax=Bodo saltans TaxID=75058 RepID=A0A0S4J1R9_BODSA|nr:Hypothetical protein, putative [Bodo saltans]|eukprot:CUG60609.1 Hypothetical protein, putative [Bodo saltans]
MVSRADVAMNTLFSRGGGNKKGSTCWPLVGVEVDVLPTAKANRRRLLSRRPKLCLLCFSPQKSGVAPSHRCIVVFASAAPTMVSTLLRPVYSAIDVGVTALIPGNDCSSDRCRWWRVNVGRTLSAFLTIGQHSNAL